MLPAGFPWPSPAAPVAFVDVASGCEARTGQARDGTQTSFSNEREVQAVAEVLSRLLRGGRGGDALMPGDVGVITPYNGQVKALREALPALAIAPVGGAGDAAGGEGGVEVRSVDGFQGREKEVIVFSAVRANRQGAVGFLSDARRLNVAITRAKRGLVVVGHRATLQTDPLWARWLAWVASRGCLMTEGELMLPQRLARASPTASPRGGEAVAQVDVRS